MARPTVQVLFDDERLLPKTRAALKGIACDFFFAPLSACPDSLSQPHTDARLVVTNDLDSLTRNRLADVIRWSLALPCATLVMGPSTSNGGAGQSASTTEPTVSFVGPLSSDALAGRILGMCQANRAWRDLRRTADKHRRQHQRLQAELSRIRNELSDAEAIQREMHKHALPIVDGADIETMCQPAGSVSGDFYHVERLDEHHIAMAVVDVTGHGVSAGLLAAFTGRALRGIVTDGVRVSSLEPARVLVRLNEELLGLDLSGCQFIAATYAVYNEQMRTVRWARGGAPFPIHLPNGESARYMKSGGPIIGIDRGAKFETVELELSPGDQLLFYSDGLEALILNEEKRAHADSLGRTEWFRHLHNQRLTDRLADLKSLSNATSDKKWERDDITVVAVTARPCLEAVPMHRHSTTRGLDSTYRPHPHGRGSGLTVATP